MPEGSCTLTDCTDKPITHKWVKKSSTRTVLQLKLPKIRNATDQQVVSFLLSLHSSVSDIIRSCCSHNRVINQSRMICCFSTPVLHCWQLPAGCPWHPQPCLQHLQHLHSQTSVSLQPLHDITGHDMTSAAPVFAKSLVGLWPLHAFTWCNRTLHDVQLQNHDSR